MKKKKRWSPSQAQLEKINALVLESHRVRRKIIKTNYANESNVRPYNVPDKIIPKMEHKYRTSSFSRYEQYRRELKRLGKLYGEGMKSYMNVEYKQRYLEILLSWFQDSDIFDESYLIPIGWQGRYFSKAQIEYYDGNARKFLEWYNKVQAMPIAKFAQMYERGFIVYLKYIYRDLLDNDGYSDFIDEQLDLYHIYNKGMAHGGFTVTPPKLKEHATQKEKMRYPNKKKYKNTF